MKISIITITYNRAHLIGQTIQSVLDQTYQNYELIIIDDGSTDNTNEVVATYINKAPEQIRYIKSQKLGIPSKLRNIGLKNATGEIISILDSDDIWLEDKLYYTYNIFKKYPDAMFMFHNLKHFSTLENLSSPYYTLKQDFYKNILKELILGEILAFPIFSIRSSLIKEIGFFDESIMEGQHDFIIKAALNHKFYYLNKPLTLMRRHGSNLTKNFDIIHSLDAIKTFENLFKSKKIETKWYLLATNFLNFKTANYYLSINDNKKGIQHLNSILNNNTFFNKWYIKAIFLKLKVS